MDRSKKPKEEGKMVIRGKKPTEDGKLVIRGTGVPNGDETDKLRILSIDGGGVRGIIPAVILKHLEDQLQKHEEDKDIRLADYFDLIVGTSTGGLITALITTRAPEGVKSAKRLPFKAQEVVNFYRDDAPKIFPETKLAFLRPVLRLLRPGYNPKTLIELLENYCGNRTLSEALTNVIIPSFDIERQSPVFFSSWEPKLKAALVKDVCLATTAAPTFLPPASFTVPPTEDTPTEDKKKKKEEEKDHTKKNPQTLQFNMIDGGMVANNPTYVGITQAIRYLKDNLQGKAADKKYFENLLVLSLGTGRHRTGYSADEAEKWGELKWLHHDDDTPLISSLQNASADMVDYSLSTIFEAKELSLNYLRIQTDLSKDSAEEWKLDNAKEENLTALEHLANKLLGRKATRVNCETGEFVESSVSNSEALDSFAERLVFLRKKYGPHQDPSAESSRAREERGN